MVWCREEAFTGHWISLLFSSELHFRVVWHCLKMTVTTVFALRCWICLPFGNRDHFSSEAVFSSIVAQSTPAWSSPYPHSVLVCQAVLARATRDPKEERPEGLLDRFSPCCSAVVHSVQALNLEDIWQVEKLKTRGCTFNANLEMCLATPIWEANSQGAESIWQRNTFCLGHRLGREKK